MQLFRLTLLAAVTIPQVCACIRVHARQSYLPWPDTDHISVEIWNDHGVYLNCGDCNWKSYAGQDCKRSCGHFDITIYNEFQTVKVYQKKNKKTYVLKTKKPKSQVYCCLEGERGGCGGKCSNFRKCWDSGHANCKGLDCPNCDKAWCGKTKRGLLDGLETGELSNTTAT